MMQSKFQKIKGGVSRFASTLSMIITLLSNFIYIGYLALALNLDIGNRTVNLLLISATLIFSGVYVLLHTKGNETKRGIKISKRFYKYFRFAMRLFSAATAIYALCTAINALSFIGILISLIGVIFLILRIALDIGFALVKIGARKISREVKEHIRVGENKNDAAIEISPDDYCVFSTEDNTNK